MDDKAVISAQQMQAKATTHSIPAAQAGGLSVSNANVVGVPAASTISGATVGSSAQQAFNLGAVPKVSGSTQQPTNFSVSVPSTNAAFSASPATLSTVSAANAVKAKDVPAALPVPVVAAASSVPSVPSTKSSAPTSTAFDFTSGAGFANVAQSGPNFSLSAVPPSASPPSAMSAPMPMPVAGQTQQVYQTQQVNPMSQLPPQGSGVSAHAFLNPQASPSASSNSEGGTPHAMPTPSAAAVYQQFSNPIQGVQQQQPVASVDFSDGYTIRQMFEFFRMSLPCAPMFFTEDGIMIERANGSDTLLVRCFIHRRNVVGYTFDKANCNDPSNGRHIVNFNLGMFVGQIKSIAKKEGIRLNSYKELPQYVVGQSYGGNKSTSQSVMYLHTSKYEDAFYSIEDGVNKDTMPNCVVQLTSFCSFCTNAARSKYAYVYFMAYPEGLKVIAGSQTQSDGRHEVWGNCKDYILVDKVNEAGEKYQEWEQQIPFVTCVPLKDIKALNKINNFHLQGIVRVYSKRNQLTRLEIPTGTFTDVTIMLQGVNPESTVPTKAR